jgi:hypothetical protein
MDRDLVRGSDMVDVLYDMLRDSDGIVVTNCIVVLNEIMLEEGGEKHGFMTFRKKPCSFIFRNRDQHSDRPPRFGAVERF